MKSKNKALKTFGFTSLALLMGIAGTMAFAPIGTTTSPIANASEISTESGGLITPKADDPVIYTTESGLEIKWGNAAPNNIKTPLGSGNLSAFPYFTTSDGNTTYTWVIIGRNSDTGVFESAVSSHLFSSWKTSTYSSTTYINKNAYSKSFFDTTYENTTPAGSAINSVIPSKSYVMDFAHNATPKTNDNEIPSGCVLVLSNAAVGTGAYNVTYKSDAYSSSHYYGGSYTGAESIAITMNQYRANGSFGLSTIAPNIQPVDLTTHAYYWYATSSSNKDWGEFYDSAKSQYIYPLGCNDSSTFFWGNYLTAEQVKLSVNQWVRGHHQNTTGETSGSSPRSLRGSYLDTSGTISDGLFVNNANTSYRPAFVLKIS